MNQTHSSANDDNQIIELSIETPELFEQIFTRHCDAIFSYFASRTERESARDLTSETFIKAFKIRDRYMPTNESARAWLYSLAYKLLLTRNRSTFRRNRLFLKSAAHSESIFLPEDSSDPHTRNAVVTLLKNEKAIDREVFLLFCLEELSYQEISKVCNLPIGTVKSKIARTKKRLAQQLGDASDEHISRVLTPAIKENKK